MWTFLNAHILQLYQNVQVYLSDRSGLEMFISTNTDLRVNITYWKYNRHLMTDGNIPKYILFANEKMNRRTSAILFTLEMAFHWECRDALSSYFLTVYTVSYIPPLSQSDCMKFNIIFFYICIFAFDE